MGTKELRKRKIWQDVSGKKAGAAKKNLRNIIKRI